jgi:hypothetical protein
MSQQDGWVYCIALETCKDNTKYKCGCIAEQGIEGHIIKLLRQETETDLEIMFLKKVCNPKRAEGKLLRLLPYCDKDEKIVTANFEQNIKDVLKSVCLEFDPISPFPGRNLERFLNNKVLVEVDYPQLKLKHITRTWQYY